MFPPPAASGTNSPLWAVPRGPKPKPKRARYVSCRDSVISRSFEYTAPERVQNHARTFKSFVGGNLAGRSLQAGVLLKSATHTFFHHLNCRHCAQDLLAHPDCRARFR